MRNDKIPKKRIYRTIQNAFSFDGIGVHSGKKTNVEIIPSEGNIRFMKKGVDDSQVEACIDNVKDTVHGTSIAKGEFCFRTVEHLLGTLFAFEIQGVTVVLEKGEEIPILDGSAEPIMRKLQAAKIIEKDGIFDTETLQIDSPLAYSDRKCFISVFPCPSLRISYLISYDNYPELTQMRTFEVTTQNFVNEIASARTYAFLEWVQPLREKGLIKGGSFKNALVYSKDGLVNETPLRYDDEFVRHKILDFLGDLSLLCSRVTGHFVVLRGGHTTHIEFLKQLRNQTKNKAN